MPTTVQLIRKTNLNGGPVAFETIDDEMRVHFEQPSRDTEGEIFTGKYLCGWYDAIGFRLATGRTWEEIKTSFRESDLNELVSITEWLEANFDENHFWSRN